MSKIYFQDTAILTFQPLVDLTNSSFVNLSSQAPLHWLNSDTNAYQWGAFMHFYGPTRKLLKLGGLNLEVDDFLKMSSSNEKWNVLTSKLTNCKLDNQECLYLIRLLFYLGFYRQGLEFCENIRFTKSSYEERFYAKYLSELGKSIIDPFNWTPVVFSKEIESLKEDLSPFLLFHIFLLFCKFYIRNSNDIDLAKKYLNQALLIVKKNDFSSKVQYTNLAQLRLNKYQADFFFKYGNKQKAVELLIRSCELSDDSTKDIPTDSSLFYLFVETKRRLLDALTLHFFRSDIDFELAFRFAQESVRIDPYCSYAQLLAGKMASKVDKNISKSYFEKAVQYGFLERPYAKQALSIQVYDIDKVLSSELQNEALEGNIFLIREKENVHDSNDLIKLPIEIQSLSKIAENDIDETQWKQFNNSLIYRRCLPFWELNTSDLKSPIFCNVPLTAFKVFKDKEIPWFKTLYLQRAMPVNFREELFFATSPHTSFAISNLSHGSSIKILDGRSNENEFVLSVYESFEYLPKLERTHFSRLLGALGFYKEALKVIPFLDKNANWDLIDEYTFCTKLFLQHIYFAGTNIFPVHELEFAFQKLSNSQESIRMRLVLAMLGIVYFAKSKNVPLVKKWRDRGFESLNEMHESLNFDDFEKCLLTSRFYRAASYYPYLLNDESKLRNEAIIFESFARSLIPQNDMQKIIGSENLFPMLESSSRIYAQIGEKQRALNLMEEIVNKIDPLDAKAWIQVGEARENSGNFEKALEAFQVAVNLGVPLGGIASYRAGRVCEKLDNPYLANYYYIRSLKFCPRGVSPLKRLHVISDKLNDTYLKKWSEGNLNNLKNHFKSVT